MTTAQALSQCAIAYTSNRWSDDWQDRFERITSSAPSGSGIDCGTSIDIASQRPERLLLSLSYHHMNDVGYYDGWTDHNVIITPSITFGLSIRITGRNRNEIKDYLSEVYAQWLAEEFTSWTA